MLFGISVSGHTVNYIDLYIDSYLLSLYLHVGVTNCTFIAIIFLT